MYYSIPAIKDAAYLLEEVELSSLEKSSIRRNCISCQSRMQTESETSLNTVTRRSRISFECHSTMLMADLLDYDEEEKQEEGCDDLDYLLNLVGQFAR